MVTAGYDLEVSPDVALVVERALNQVALTQTTANLAQFALRDLKVLLNIPVDVPIQVVAGSKIRLFMEEPANEEPLADESELLRMVKP